MRQVLFVLMAVIGVLLAYAPGQASIMTYDSEAGFLAAAGDLEFESFETLPPSDTAVDFLNTVSTSKFDVATSQNFMQIWGDPPVLFAPHGDQVLFWYSSTGGSITFDNFDPSTNAFGLHITDWATTVPTNTPVNLIFSNDLGDTHTIASISSPLPDYNELFFGVISDTPFSSVTITTESNDGWIFFDKIYTNAVPEPATAILLGFGLMGLARIARKKEHT